MRDSNGDSWGKFSVSSALPNHRKKHAVRALALLCVLSGLAGVVSLGWRRPDGMTTVALPVTAIKAGTALKSDMFESIEIKSVEAISDPVTRANQISGRYAKIDLPAQVQVSLRSLMDPPNEGALNVSSGSRAVTLDVDEVSSIEGYALPGTRVDVALTYNEGQMLASKIVVQNALVLSFGGDTTSVGNIKLSGRGRTSSRTLTLQASAADVLRITTAKQLGKLSLYMRAAGDDQAPKTLEFSELELRGNKQVIKNETCRNGRIKSKGREYNLNCDGGIDEVVVPSEAL